MKTFEKVYWTAFILSIPLLLAGLFVGYMSWTDPVLMIACSIPFFTCATTMVLDFLICEVILRRIWKVDFTLFPSLFTEV